MSSKALLLPIARWLGAGAVCTVAVAWTATLLSPDSLMRQPRLLTDQPWPWPQRPNMAPDPSEPIMLIAGVGLNQRRGVATWRDLPESAPIAVYPFGAFAGLPFRALCSQTYWGSWSGGTSGPIPPVQSAQLDWAWRGLPTYSGPDSWRTLPLRPLWAGFLADTALWGACIGRSSIAVRRLRRRSRLRRRLCADCGHALGGLTSCPECGLTSGGTA
jgi:hypothetical protein